MISGKTGFSQIQPERKSDIFVYASGKCSVFIDKVGQPKLIGNRVQKYLNTVLLLWQQSCVWIILSTVTAHSLLLTVQHFTSSYPYTGVANMNVYTQVDINLLMNLHVRVLRRTSAIQYFKVCQYLQVIEYISIQLRTRFGCR